MMQRKNYSRYIMCIAQYFFLVKANLAQLPVQSPVRNGQATGSADYSSMISDTVSEKIYQLHLLASRQRDQGDMMESIRSIQKGLVLQEGVKPTIQGFGLCVYAGNVIAPLSERYGLEFYKRATTMVPYLDKEAIPGIFSLYTTMAGAYYKLQQPDTALLYHRKAIAVADQDMYVSKASARNNLGVFYSNIKQDDSARYYFIQALDLLGDRKNHIGLYCAIQDNIAQLSIRQGKYQTAYQTFSYNDSVYTVMQNHQKYVSNKIRLLETMKQLKLTGLKQQMDNLMPYINLHRFNIQSRDVLAFYRFAQREYASHGDQPGVVRMLEKYIHLTDSLTKAASEQLHLVTSSFLNVQEASFKHELAFNKLVAERTRSKLTSARRTILISVFSGASIVLLLSMYFRARKKELHAQKQIAETELKRREMEARLMEQELVLKKRDLTNMVLHNTQVYDSNQKMIEKLRHISHHKKDMESEIRAMLVELQSQNQISDRSIGLQSKIEEVNEAFYERLATKYPGLTKAESELCGYIRINLSSKDISLLKNVEASSVKMGKYRLRKKLGILPEEDLYGFVKEV